MAAILQMIYQMYYLLRECLYFDSNVTGIPSYGFNWQEVSIGLRNCLTQKRRQATIETQDDLVHWRNASPSLNVLKQYRYQ